MKLHEMSISDRNASYADTYLSAEIEGEETPVYVYNFLEEDMVVVRVNKYINTDKDIEHVIPTVNLRPIISDLGMMKLRDNIWYVCRHPSRQWKRGLKYGTLNAYLLGKRGDVVMSKVDNSFCMEISNFFVPSADYKKHKNILSRDFAIAHNILYFRTLPIGKVEDNKIKLHTELDFNSFLKPLLGVKGYELDEGV